MNRVLLIVFLSACMLASCANKKNLVFKTEEKNIIHPALPAPLNLKPIKWKAWNKDIIIQQCENPDPYYNEMISISPEDYLTLGKNIQDIIRYIRQQQSIIQYYREILINE